MTTPLPPQANFTDLSVSELGFRQALNALVTHIGENDTVLSGVIAAQSSGVIGFATKALMDADLVHPEGAVAYVTNDAVTDNNINYRKVGASGAGSWAASTNTDVGRIKVGLGDHKYLTQSTFTNGTTFTSATYFNPAVFKHAGFITKRSLITSATIYAIGAGTAEIHAFKNVDGKYICIAVWPISWTTQNYHTFSAGAEIPNDFYLEAGDFLGLKIITSAVVPYAVDSVANYTTVTGDTGVGSVVTLASPTLFKGSFSYTAIEQDRFVAMEISDILSAIIENKNCVTYAIGDSTVAARGAEEGLLTLMRSKKTKINLAVPGQSIAQQKAVWQATVIKPYLTKYVIVQVGLNDMQAAEAASIAIARLQDLINTIRATVGQTVPILISQMIPCKQRWTDLYGAVDGPISQQKWVDMNNAIAGAGPTPITGVDGRCTSHVPLMAAANGDLAAIYDTGDKIHPNNAGRTVNTEAWKAALLTMGISY